MLSHLIVFLLSSSAVFTAPTPTSAPSEPKTKSPPVEIITMESELLPDGSFHYSFEGADGTKARQEGTLKYFDEKNAGEVVKGSYEYVGDDGKLYAVSYYADETGFHAEGDHIPKIPEVIAKALVWSAEHPYTEDNAVETA
ncbi:larval cuticle protein 16/17-like [Agrilus planipennis]|uniref:Larval cuticle protein 16/17-like n=1 Tax=Agrilus planipennis TaxID=224129 RepID=A0A1W4XDH8_AGRPL|nr:larval cuticle protein 16/17-like [Agrilus planipennis]